MYVNMFKSAENTHWKNLNIKFMPDVYGSEVTGNTQSRPRPRRMTSGPGKKNVSMGMQFV